MRNTIYDFDEMDDSPRPKMRLIVKIFISSLIIFFDGM